MTTHTKHAHGTFSWAELATTDAEAAKKFYGSLLGWAFDDMPSGPGMIYTMCKVGSEYASALYTMADTMKGVPPHWSSYITVDDVDAAAKLAAANGGTLVKEPFDVMDVGRMAVVTDPTGATFCLWTAKKHIGAGVIHDPGAMTWNELYTGDVDRAGRFYAAVLGWSLEPVGLGKMGTYTLFKRPGEQASVGGMMPLGPEMKGVPPHWLVYFAVTDCDASTARAKAFGASVMMEPTAIPNVGHFSILLDPQGAAFALYKGTH